MIQNILHNLFKIKISFSLTPRIVACRQITNEAFEYEQNSPITSR